MPFEARDSVPTGRDQDNCLRSFSSPADTCLISFSSHAGFSSRCKTGRWVYRVAHRTRCSIVTAGIVTAGRRTVVGGRKGMPCPKTISVRTLPR